MNISFIDKYKALYESFQNFVFKYSQNMFLSNEILELSDNFINLSNRVNKTSYVFSYLFLNLEYLEIKSSSTKIARIEGKYSENYVFIRYKLKFEGNMNIFIENLIFKKGKNFRGVAKYSNEDFLVEIDNIVDFIWKLVNMITRILTIVSYNKIVNKVKEKPNKIKHGEIVDISTFILNLKNLKNSIYLDFKLNDKIKKEICEEDKKFDSLKNYKEKVGYEL